jgi:dihydroorotase
MCDLLIKGGVVVDPSQGLNAARDIALSDGKVAAIEHSIDDGEAREVVDAAGLIVAPGLIDLHVHVFWGVSHFGIDPDITSLAKGVTTAVDAGSAGSATFPAFRRYVLQTAETRIYSLLNISAMGMIAKEVGELEELRWAIVEDAVATGLNNPDYVVGIKARLSRQIAGEQDVEALNRAIEAAAAINGFVMIHVGDTKTPLEELTAMLRPGDVVTHAFHDRSEGLLDDVGRVKPGIKEAQTRGVVFDVGHGAGSFAFDTAEKALADGFRPDNISSDLHIYNVEGPVHDQVSVLSKFMCLGLSLDDVIRLSTESASKVLGSTDALGTLRVGAEGDVTLMRREEGDFTFTDSVGVSVQGRERLSHVLTVKDGRVYRPWLR